MKNRLFFSSCIKIFSSLQRYTLNEIKDVSTTIISNLYLYRIIHNYLCPEVQWTGKRIRSVLIPAQNIPIINYNRINYV